MGDARRRRPGEQEKHVTDSKAAEGAAPAGKAGEVSDDRKVRRREPVWLEYGKAILTAVALALVIRTFGVQAFRIPSPSMEDTLLVGDHLFVSKFLYGAEIPFTGGIRLPGFRDPERGDVIVFRFPEDPSQDYIKRCVGVPGDTVEYRDKVLYVNGERQEEPYTKFADGDRISPNRDNFGPIEVPEGKYFMMGDNRDRSSDSRYWGFVDHTEIRGKAIFIYWSWDPDANTIRFSRLFDLIH
jgi:signal peptidase I